MAHLNVRFVLMPADDVAVIRSQVARLRAMDAMLEDLRRMLVKYVCNGEVITKMEPCMVLGAVHSEDVGEYA